MLLSDLSLLCEVAPTGFLPKYKGRGFMTEGQVPPRVQWEGPHDRGADYLSPQHYTVFNQKRVGQPWLIVVSAEGLIHSTKRCRSQRTLAVQTRGPDLKRLCTTTNSQPTYT